MTLTPPDPTLTHSLTPIIQSSQNLSGIPVNKTPVFQLTLPFHLNSKLNTLSLSLSPLNFSQKSQPNQNPNHSLLQPLNSKSSSSSTMKASLKFREEQKPLFKAKVPLSILGLPFQSGIAAGDSKELSLSLATFFDSGPSFRASYRPNDAFNPFSLVVKTGIGSFGSPIDAPMTMSAEFNFPVNGGFGQNYNSTPRFFLHFKPSFGDFSLKRSHQSTIPVLKKSFNGGVFEEEDGEVEVVEKPLEKLAALPLRSSVEEAVAGVQLGAKTVLPIRNGAVLKLRWGVKFPEGFQSLFGKDHDRAGRFSPRGIPRLVLNKIGIEHVARQDKKMKEVVGAGVGPQKKEEGIGGGGGADLAETCFDLKRQMETLRAENAGLGKALEGLKVEFGNGFSKGRGRGGERKSLGEGKEMEGGVNVSDDMNNKA